MHNLLFRTDSYKTSHWYQLPPKTTKLRAYLSSRGGRYGQTVFAGLQYLIKTYFTGPPVNALDVVEATSRYKAHGMPFNTEGWLRVVDKHGGRIPLRLRAVPEGSVVPVHNALMVVENTDEELAWLVGWFETMIVRAGWYATNVATVSWHCKKIILDYLVRTSDNPMGEIDFKLHDFGGRGASSAESAAIGGCAHLFNFKGSDTFEGVMCAMENYGAKEMPAFSIPAMEHSTVISWGKEHEAQAYANMISESKKRGFNTVACVSDSYDFFNAVENIWGDELLGLVKDSGMTVVIRPDSGDPSEVNVKALQILERKVGMTKNSKGYKVLPSYYRLIQGDGNNNEDDIDKVLHAVTSHGYSASNISFGMGGGLLQKHDRDTQKFAYKICEIIADGQTRPVSKAPKTDMGKASRGGHLDLVFRDGQYQTVEGEQRDSSLVTVFEDGKLLKEWTLAEIRERTNKALL